MIRKNELYRTSVDLYIGKDVPFIQAVKPNVDVLVNEESVAPLDKTVQINVDHMVVSKVDAASLDKLVQCEVVPQEHDPFNKLVHSLTSTTPTTRDETSNVIAQEIEVVNTLRPPSVVDCMKANGSLDDENNLYYQETQQGSLQHSLKAMKYVEPPDVACLQDDNVDEPHFKNTVQVNVEMEGYMDVDNEEDKYCLDNMSIGFEEDTCNKEIKVTLYEEEHTEMCDTMDTAVQEKTLVNETRVVKRFTQNTKMDLDPFITDVMHTEKMAVEIKANRSESMNLDSVDKNDPKDVRLQDEDIMYDIDLYFVYFPLNEPQLHWAFTELHIRTGLDVREIRSHSLKRKSHIKLPFMETVVYGCVFCYTNLTSQEVPLVIVTPLRYVPGNTESKLGFASILYSFDLQSDSENYEPLSRKFPIVNWEYQLLGKMEAKDMYVYKLTRADGSSSYHGDTQAFLRRLDRQDLNDLYRLVQERFQDHPLEGHDLLLWGDLRMIFDPDEKDELWMNQLDWKLLRWKLYESCGVHTLFMDGKPMEINMLVEKKYPLIKELLEKMLNLQLEAEEESTMAFELIKFIKSLLEE
ncbi:hypothetical protein Tco_1501524 [Tanacetum coccineum]